MGLHTLQGSDFFNSLPFFAGSPLFLAFVPAWRRRRACCQLFLRTRGSGAGQTPHLCQDKEVSEQPSKGQLHLAALCPVTLSHGSQGRELRHISTRTWVQRIEWCPPEGMPKSDPVPNKPVNVTLSGRSPCRCH